MDRSTEAKKLLKEVNAVLDSSHDFTPQESKAFKRLLLTKKEIFERIFQNSTTARNRVLENIGLDKKIIDSLNSFSTAEFIEPNDVFLDIKDFFTNNYPNFSVEINKFEERELSSGTKRIFIKSISENSNQMGRDGHLISKKYAPRYKLELESLEKEGLIVEKKHLNGNSFASIRIKFSLFDGIVETYVISFKIKDDYSIKENVSYENEINKLEILFKKASIEQIISSKLGALRINVDELTGLYNHRYINSIKDKRYAIVVIDVNDFKKFNDRNGHLKGDKALIELGKILKNSIRLKDKACRSGGDEFLIFVDCEGENANQILEVIKQRINHEITLANETKEDKLKYSITVGYELYEEGKTYEERLKDADFKMYKNKTKRGKRHRVASQYRDYIEDGSIMDNIKIMALLNKELIVHIGKKLINYLGASPRGIKLVGADFHL